MEFRVSSLPLLVNCSGPLVLPNEEFRLQEAIDRAEKAADWGKMVHTWKETGEIVHDDKRTRTLFEKLPKPDRETWWPSDGEHEVTVSLACDGARQAQTHLAVTHPAWITGHIDYVRYAPHLVINDLKTQKRYYDNWTGEERFAPNPGSPQLLGYALGVATADEYEGRVELQIDHWPREPKAAREAGPRRITLDTHTDELYTYWDVLERVYAESKMRHPPLNPGPHCKFCPAQTYCLFNPN